MQTATRSAMYDNQDGSYPEQGTGFPQGQLPARPGPVRFQQVPQEPPDYSTATNRFVEPADIAIAPLKPKMTTSQRNRRRRLMWIIPLAIVGIALSILFQIYKSDFERWIKPLTDWLSARKSWSWTIPTVILIILNFPPLFGQEIIQLIVGLTYPLGVAIGIGCAGSVLGELACFLVFRFFFTPYVDKKIDQKVSWAATARVAQEAGFRGVLVIRYSIVPPHLANPLFACTGMPMWIYMGTVFLSLPKQIIFVIFGSPSSENSTAVKWCQAIAIIILVFVTIFASRWMRPRLSQAVKEIKMERGIPDEEEGEDV